MRLEVVGTVAQRNSSPVIGATTEHARPPPFEATRRLFAGAHTTLSGYIPAAVHRRVVEAKGFLRCTDSRKRRQVRRLEHGCLGFGGISAPGLEHEYLRTVHTK